MKNLTIILAIVFAAVINVNAQSPCDSLRSKIQAEVFNTIGCGTSTGIVKVTTSANVTFTSFCTGTKPTVVKTDSGIVASNLRAGAYVIQIIDKTKCAMDTTFTVAVTDPGAPQKQ